MSNQSIPFIEYNKETLYFELSERALELIINNKKRMGIISIFGEKNSGKSFIMNHILADD
jgi:ribosome biogenesis GTPase A